MEKELEESVRKSSNHEIGINLISVISQVFEVDHNGRAQDITSLQTTRSKRICMPQLERNSHQKG